jgi:hypothetical protein
MGKMLELKWNSLCETKAGWKEPLLLPVYTIWKPCWMLEPYPMRVVGWPEVTVEG